MDTSGANAEDPLQTPVGAIARVASRETIEVIVRSDFEQ